LNLTLEGSIGRFRTGPSAESQSKSLEVLYLQTHIGFDPSVASNEGMLKHLEPVREMFDLKDLDFDEIMQRDIDDTRVSTELIPYLLDKGARDTIKFFPPIVVVVIPVKDRELKPDQLYPPVSREKDEKDEERGTAQIIRSGPIGAEAFQFEYPLVDGVPRPHDLARLKLNTNRVRLVIIDGQHRAMALIALYRNLRGGWEGKRKEAFMDYYREWTKARVGGFDLDEIELPIIVCAYPDLDKNFKGDFDIIRAARSTFLTLNKAARKVSNSRNILLDDRDLISHFLRGTLGHIKAKDAHSGSPMRIWNVELDQYRDRTKIESPVACTGVTHVYYAIEHMLLDDNDVKGIGARSGKFHKRAYVEGSLLRRLDGENLLGAETAATLKRHTYSSAAALELSKAFHERYGKYIIDALDTFKPFEVHNRAALELSQGLLQHANPQIRTILFEGQNIGRTFYDYLDYMVGQERKAKDSNSSLAPEIRHALTLLRATEQAVEAARLDFLARRAELFLSEIGDKVKLKNSDGQVSKNLRKPLDDLYDNVFTSIAFQAAVTCGYFLIIEKAERLAADRGVQIPDRATTFQEYIAALNEYFIPSTLPRLKALLRAFFYDVDGERAEEWKPVPTHDTFGEVIFRGEMKPDEWPKYRYLLLELWRPADPTINEVRKAERDNCRRQAFESLHTRRVKDLCVEMRKNEQDLTPDEWQGVFQKSYKAFDALLTNLGLRREDRWSEAQWQDVLEKPQLTPLENDEESSA
jgi:hypothetical protein